MTWTDFVVEECPVHGVRIVDKHGDSAEIMAEVKADTHRLAVPPWCGSPLRDMRTLENRLRARAARWSQMELDEAALWDASQAEMVRWTCAGYPPPSRAQEALELSACPLSKDSEVHRCQAHHQ